MENRINRSVVISGMIFGLMAAGTSVVFAQTGSQGSYQGVSRPPADDQIITTQNPEPKPPAGQPYDAQPAPPPQTAPAYAPQPPAYSDQRTPAADPAMAPAYPNSTDGTDDGIVRVAPQQQKPQPGLDQRASGYAPDPDGDIVHPRPPRPGELGEGTMIRVRLLTRLSTSQSEQGEPFRSQVASDVLQNGRVVIPAGAEIAGRVSQVSTGHAGGYGSMRLEPEELILPDGSRFRLHAEVTSTPGSGAHVVGEGTIRPDSRAKKDGIEYGGAVGVGVITGAVVGGPVGAAAGGLIGAGVITVHLLVSHPQATLESGTVMRLMLTDPLYLVPADSPGN
jgi:type IV secretory pathway VirB10-like protein